MSNEIFEIVVNICEEKKLARIFFFLIFKIFTAVWDKKFKQRLKFSIAMIKYLEKNIEERKKKISGPNYPKTNK